MAEFWLKAPKGKRVVILRGTTVSKAIKARDEGRPGWRVAMVVHPQVEADSRKVATQVR